MGHNQLFLREGFFVNKLIKKMRTSYITPAIFLSLMVLTGDALASDSLGTMASTIIKTFASLARLITAGAYIAGLAFSVGAIMKFKQHKDNPTNIPIGTPIALVFIAAALLFLPSILELTGGTMFSSGGTTAGPSGTIFTNG